MTAAQSELPLTTVHANPIDAPGMEWLKCTLDIAGGNKLLTVQECADSVRMTDRAVLKLIECGQVERVGAGKRGGGDHRITVRSWLVHVWHSWSHRHSATNAQVQSLVLELLRGLPNDLLRQVAITCTEILKSRQAAAAKLRRKDS